MKRVIFGLIGLVLCVGYLDAQTLEVPEKVKGLLLKTGASW